MKEKSIYALVTTLLIFTLAALPVSTAAQRSIKTDSRILYHDGPVMVGTTNVYMIWYGNWGGNYAVTILTDLVLNIGSSPYFLINTTYPDATGATPSGGIIYTASIAETYTHGIILTPPQIKQIVADQFANGRLAAPDPNGIYLVIASADVTDTREDGTSFCTPGASPLHGVGVYASSTFKYGFLGSANRCPATAGAHFVAADGTRLPTPSDHFEGDAMATSLARILNVTVTNPYGTRASLTGWYDRYGLENADKCAGKFGTTYQSGNGGRANMRIGQRDFLIQQNWLNGRHGRCASSYQ